MQNKNRVYDKDLRRFIYPNPNNLRRQPKSNSPYPKDISFTQKENPKSNFLYFKYTPTHYFPNRELNRHALGYPRDQGQIPVRGNNLLNYNLTYTRKTNKPEPKIYHYSISSKKEYNNQEIEEDTSSKEAQINLNLNPITYMIDNSNYNRYRQFLNRKKEENILPTKVFISDTYQYNKENLYKFRPSREKDGYKGGVINLNENKKFVSENYLKKIIFIQRWWKRLLNKNRNDYERYSSVINRKSISRSDSNNENIRGNKYIVQTTRVEVFKRHYMSIPLLKPEIITKENKVNFDRKNSEENLEIILDKDSLK